jgi:diphthine-ammonia ligase
MKFIALISGGKDSIFNILKCIEKGHELVAVANLYPKGKKKKKLYFLKEKKK